MVLLLLLLPPPPPAQFPLTGMAAVTPDPPEVATGAAGHALWVPVPVVAVPAMLPTVGAAGWLACAKYPVVAATPAMRAAAVQFDTRRTLRTPPSRIMPARRGAEVSSG
jgi:hypothetical protein